MSLHQVNKKYYAEQLLEQTPLHTGEWQSMNTSSSPAHATYELLDVYYAAHVPLSKKDWEGMIQPDLPWADDHFDERVSGKAYNPPPSHEDWPWRVRGNEDHLVNGKFSHTYPERFWPKMVDGGKHGSGKPLMATNHQGIRFEYGDLANVVDLLVDKPLTRQAYLPIWFPEDTGAVEGQRVPCTLGYHFLIRPNVFNKHSWELSCRYYIRSCDLVRHFTNDVYFAGRLMQWVAEQINERTASNKKKPVITPSTLHMYISSLHTFVGDKHHLRRILK